MIRSSNPVLLAIDTSSRWVGLALYDGAQVLCEYCWSSHDYHTVELAPAVADALAKTRIPATDLAAIAAAIGPGSFTGLRVGLALAKGIALANRLPMVGIPTLDILAVAQPVREEPLVTVLRAGRGRLAVGWYHVEKNVWQPTRKVEVLTALELCQRIDRPTLVCGELTAEEQQALSRKWKNVILASPAQSLRRPAYLAELGWRRWRAGQVDDPATMVPIYLHYNDPIPEP